MEWLDAFAAAVRTRNYAAARRLFAPGVIGFGTVACVDSLDNLELLQWRQVWEATSGFRFETATVLGDAIAATWSSDGGRRGRATIVLAEGLAVHTHFSLSP
jgi:hypothetical protein